MGHIFRRAFKRTRRDGTTYEYESPRWTIQYYRNKKQVRETLKTTKKSEAVAVLREREGDANAPTTLDWQKTTLEQLKEVKWAEFRNAGKRSERRLRINMAHLTKFFEDVRGDTRIFNLTSSDVLHYIDWRRDQGAGNGTINRETSILQNMLNLGAKQQPRLVLLNAMPTIPRLKEPPARTGFVTFAQLQKLLSGAYIQRHPWLQNFLRWAFETGWRRGEIASMEWSWVDEANRVVRVPKEFTKTDSPKSNYLSAEMLSILADQKRLLREMQERQAVAGHTVQNPTWVFLKPVNGTDSFTFGQVQKFDKVWAKVLKEAGMEGLRLHDFRRSAVVEMVQSGMPENVAMAYTGHKTRSIFERYNITTVEHQADQVSKREAYRANGNNHENVPGKAQAEESEQASATVH